MNILLVEDDRTIAEGLTYSLGQEGYQVFLADRVEKAVNIWKSNMIHLALLDLSLPDGSGYDLCRMIKKEKDIPVLFLTACDDEVNVVMGLDMGADDYITKPFRIRELLSRIKSVIRRYEKGCQEGKEVRFKIGNLLIFTDEARVVKEGNEVILTALEYKLLLVFLNNRGQVLSRNQLLENIWDVSGDFVNDNTLTVYIKRLREKLEDDPSRPSMIHTIRGLGYRMDESGRWEE